MPTRVHSVGDDDELDESFFRSVVGLHPSQIEDAICMCRDQGVVTVRNLGQVSQLDGGLRELFPQRIGYRAAIQAWADSTRLENKSRASGTANMVVSSPQAVSPASCYDDDTLDPDSVSSSAELVTNREPDLGGNVRPIQNHSIGIATQAQNDSTILRVKQEICSSGSKDSAEGIPEEILVASVATNCCGQGSKDETATVTGKLIKVDEDVDLPPDEQQSAHWESAAATELFPIHNVASNDTQNNNAIQEWQDICRAPNVELFRVRAFKQETITKEDPRGRMCAEWCIHNGCIPSSARFIPSTLLSNADDAKEFLCNKTANQIIEARKHSKYFESASNLTLYCNANRYFAGAINRKGKKRGIQRGDVVALMVPGMEGTKDRETYFGVVTSDDLVVLTPREAITNGFPAPQLFELDPPRFNGLMLRRVKWMRRCKTRDLLSAGEKQVNWLVEAAPFWFYRCANGIPKLRSPKFRAVTEAVF